MTTLRDLAVRDIGRRVRLVSGGTVVEGRLLDFTVQTDWISEQTMFQVDPSLSMGRQTVRVVIGAWEGAGLAPDVRIEFA